MDLDHFKEVNDRFGHLGGDDVLKQFAERVTGEIRTLDVVGRDGVPRPGEAGTFGRYGGEEFLLVMPETPMEGALICAPRRIRHQVRKGGNAKFHTESGSKLRHDRILRLSPPTAPARGTCAPCWPAPTRRCISPRRGAATASKLQRD